MSIEMIKKSALAAVAGCSILAVASVSAQTIIPDPPNNPYTFEGTTRLDTPLGIYICDLSLTGNVDKGSSPSDLFGTVTVTGGSVSGSFPCGLITLDNLPWGSTDNGEVLTDGSGAIVTLTNIGASAPFNLLDCDGDITVPFNNDSTASNFDLEGASFGGCTFTANASGQNVLYADPSNNVQVQP
ncbi:MAG: hypothetical protein MK005_07725 [Alcanivorax sp.]|nr:hypothetical protein [Alcanivorax sp.]